MLIDVLCPILLIETLPNLDFSLLCYESKHICLLDSKLNNRFQFQIKFHRYCARFWLAFFENTVTLKQELIEDQKQPNTISYLTRFCSEANFSTNLNLIRFGLQIAPDLLGSRLAPEVGHICWRWADMHFLVVHIQSMVLANEPSGKICRWWDNGGYRHLDCGRV